MPVAAAMISLVLVNSVQDLGPRPGWEQRVGQAVIADLMTVSRDREQNVFAQPDRFTDDEEGRADAGSSQRVEDRLGPRGRAVVEREAQ